MLFSKKAAALAAGVVAAVSIASLAQEPAAPRGSADRSRQVVVLGTIDWVERSDVSALKEGVIAEIELEVGKTVTKGQQIGYLHDKMAELTETKAKIAAANVGEIKKAEAQKELALAQNARLRRLEIRGSGNVSQDEKDKALAELAVANAALTSAKEGQELAKADYDLAIQARKEHRITAPFAGVITDRMKFAGESVRANEPVVRVGRTDKLRFVGWIPLETAYRIKANEVIDVRPIIEGTDLAIEQKKFRGKVTDVSREVNTLRRTEVKILGEIDNPDDPEHPELMLRQGMQAEMTIHLDAPPAKVAEKR